MRMRKKKNLDARMDAVAAYLVDYGEVTGGYNGVPLTGTQIDLSAVFDEARPLRLEIGCGKGQFAMEIAKQNPDVNFLAVEVNRNVIVQACEKAQREGLQNLRFLLVGAEKLGVLLPAHCAERIYLNFSCPFPKKRQAKRRLTHENFLTLYRTLLVSGGEICQKTDNMGLFEFSVCEFSKCGFVIDEISLDLHHSGIEGNIVTEYEKRFSDLGQPIYYLRAHV